MNFKIKFCAYAFWIGITFMIANGCGSLPSPNLSQEQRDKLEKSYNDYEDKAHKKVFKKKK